MKQAYANDNLSARRLALIESANKILDSFQAKGFTLTIRQLYYQMVSGNLIPNNLRSYKRIVSAMTAARMNGLTHWDAIEDRLRVPRLPYWAINAPAAILDLARQYRVDRQEGQPRYIEIWAEKDAVSSILGKVATKYHIRLMINRGYSSCSAMREAAERLKLESDPMILYLGDHDPSGLDMVRDIEDRLLDFGLRRFHINPVALTMEQIDELNLPPNPAKITDSRAAAYIQEFGRESWELDALPPEFIIKAVENEVFFNIDESLFNKRLEEEKEDREDMRALARNFDYCLELARNRE